MIFGYARVSTQDQILDRQIDQLKGCEKIFKEKITGTKADRPELEKLFDQLREGDTVNCIRLGLRWFSRKYMFSDYIFPTSFGRV